MKSVIVIILTTTLLLSCTEESHDDTSTDLIKKVETGLTSPVHIEGDSTWSIQDRMKHYGIPGVSIAVIHNGKIDWVKGYGVMDKESQEPVTDETIFQVSTIGMSLTAYGALKLVEQNKVSLDEDINSYLKSWKLPDSEFSRERKVTLKNLLSHSAGMNVHDFSGYTTGTQIPTLLEILNGSPPANSNPIMVDKEVNESLWISAGGYTILQQMMMDVESKKFPELMDELVLQPLKMNNSSFTQSLNTEQSKTAATGYLQDGSSVQGKRKIYPELASNGLWTNAEDLAKFMINIQENLKGNKSNKEISKDMAELMLTPHAQNRYGQYGLGFSIYNKQDEVYFEHHGWSAGFYSRMKSHRDNGYGVVVLTNTPRSAFVFEVFRSVALAYEWDNYFPVYQKHEIDQSLVDRLTGRYISDGKVIEISKTNNKLFYQNILDINAQELINVSSSSFASRNSTRLMQFKSNTGKETLDFINISDGNIVASFVKMEVDKKEPIEFLLDGDFEKALNAYNSIIQDAPNYPTVQEDYLNDLGRRFLREKRVMLAENTFKVNIALYPEATRFMKVMQKHAKKLEKQV